MRFKAVSTFFLALLFVLALAGAVFAGATTTVTKDYAAGDMDKWSITADKLEAQHDSEYMQAWGNATLVKGGDWLRADFARYYEATGWVFLKGNVEASWQGDTLKADEAEFDLKNMVGWLKNGYIYMAKAHIHLQSEHIKKLEGETYTFKYAKVTACSGEVPAWSIKADEGSITRGRYATLYHTKFNVKGVPVMYSPYLVLPVNEKRQSGFLIPDVGSSSRHGFNITQPYYWAIDQERDLTLYGGYLAKRGFMPGVEYRSTTDLDSKGLWKFNYIYDWRNSPDMADVDDQFQDDGLIRPNHNRYWLRSKYNGYVADPAWKMKLDLDFVSDSEFLREYKHGKLGYESSKQDFWDEFGREIAPNDSMERSSTFLLNRSWDDFGLAGKVEYTENLEYRNDNKPGDRNPTVQRFPEFNLYAFKQGVPFANFLEWEMDSQFVYLWREYGTRSSRLDLFPSVSLPVSFEGISVIPSFGLRETLYMVQNYEDEPSTTRQDNFPNRLLPEVNVKAFTEFYRVFSTAEPGQLTASRENVGDSAWTRIKHTIQPRLDYDYVLNDKDEDTLPYFDTTDRVGKRHVVTYSLTNILDRRMDTVVMAPEDNGTAVAVIEPDYLDFLRLRLEQSYDLEESQRESDLDDYSRKPFSDIMAELIVSPLEYLDLISRTYVSPYEWDVTEQENLVRMFYEGYGDVYFGYDYLAGIDEYLRQDRDGMQILKVGGNFYLFDWLKASAELRFDLDGHKDLEKSVSIAWLHQCFTIEALYSVTSYDERISLWFNLINWGNSDEGDGQEDN